MDSVAQGVQPPRNSVGEPGGTHGPAARLRPFGTSIFATISALAAKHGAVNLGQGFPDFDGPEFAKEAAIAAIRAGKGQYERMSGVPALNRAIADRWRIDSGIEVDPDLEITVTSGCTEAIAATLLGLLDPGDEVLLVEPYYDSYRACVAMAGAVPRYVRMRPPRFRLPIEELEAAITARTRGILVNTPHNPTGRVYDDAELAAIAELARRHDLTVISDEVYEKLAFARPHRSIATLPGMRERTIVLSSLGKTFSLTGWKIGWAIAPPGLTAAVRAAHQFLTFSSATPLQHAAAAALRCEETYYAELLDGYLRRRGRLLDALDGAGFRTFVPEGSYFVIADCAPLGFDDDAAFCTHLIESAGVAAIPVGAFLHDRGPVEEGCRTLVRFAFCKRDETLDEAARRLKARFRAR
ncbi:MAG TPA: aminotransferase class I/II-fold pyridoxal phosphate-dependent enzyme [Phycisphaerales bacterium]|nr:aminotransferase class I/II-fold pyridoxal phosphate-dependent enzyme [Phycisphaerales bacterium]HMP36645.1 aminotransferase class I/II-fold pyridoxal phosphate-dependent enzyme [Phycisphaerales bacterium]